MTVAVDFDGTVANSMPILEMLAVDLVTEGVGLTPTAARRWYRETAGLPFHEQVAPLGQYPGIVAEFAWRKINLTLEAQPWGDVNELAAITERVVLVSSTRTALLKGYLDRWEGLRPLFNEVRGWEEGATKTNQIMRSGASTFIGDTNRDRTYAHWAGATFLGVRRGVNYLDDGYHNLRDLVRENWPPKEDNE